MEKALGLVASQAAHPALRSIAQSGVEFLGKSSAAYAGECAEALANAPLVDLGSAFEKVHKTLEAVEIMSSDTADIRSKELRATFSEKAWPSGHSQGLRDRALTYWQTCQNAEGSVESPAGFSFTGTWQAFRDEVEKPLTASDIVSRTGSYKELAQRIGQVNTRLDEELKSLEALVRALKIISAFIGIALSIVSLVAP